MRMCSVFTTSKVQSVRLCLNWLPFIHTQLIIAPLLMEHAYFQRCFALRISAYLLAFPSGNARRASRIVLPPAFPRHFRTRAPWTEGPASLRTAPRAARRAPARNLQLKGAFWTLQFTPRCSRASLLPPVIWLNVTSSIPPKLRQCPLPLSLPRGQRPLARNVGPVNAVAKLCPGLRATLPIKPHQVTCTSDRKR